jgi:hypothetical protein
MNGLSAISRSRNADSVLSSSAVNSSKSFGQTANTIASTTRGKFRLRYQPESPAKNEENSLISAPARKLPFPMMMILLTDESRLALLIPSLSPRRM